MTAKDDVYICLSLYNWNKKSSKNEQRERRSSETDTKKIYNKQGNNVWAQQKLNKKNNWQKTIIETKGKRNITIRNVGKINRQKNVSTN